MTKTYILIGNVDNWPHAGMNKDRWELDYFNSCMDGGDGSVETEWQISEDAKVGDQVVLLRTGKLGTPGIIGFGLKCEGHAKENGSDRQYPVRFYNLRSVMEDPFILTQDLITTRSIRTQKDEGKQHIYYNNKRPALAANEISKLNTLCHERLGVPLAILCSEPMAEEYARRGLNEGESDEEAAAALQDRPDLAPRTRQQLIAARIGQGVFRERVLAIEPHCRLTGVLVPEHLRASHMKPWRISDDFERLDRNNGLMLAPHVDHLFDRGYITFDLNGELLLSRVLPPELTQWWALRQRVPPKEFNNRQKAYLEYHQTNCFRG